VAQIHVLQQGDCSRRRIGRECSLWTSINSKRYAVISPRPRGPAKLVPNRRCEIRQFCASCTRDANLKSIIALSAQFSPTRVTKVILRLRVPAHSLVARQIRKWEVTRLESAGLDTSRRHFLFCGGKQGNHGASIQSSAVLIQSRTKLAADQPADTITVANQTKNQMSYSSFISIPLVCRDQTPASPIGREL